jgi:putative addiction module component (TIGR02574 family)
MKPSLLSRALELPPPERIRLADALYRSVDQEAESEDIPAELLAELERRDTAYEANPASGCTLETLRKRLFPEK